jgi:LysM repeat protein
MEDMKMAKDKVFLNDDQLDAVGGGTILPYQVNAGDTLESVAAQYHVTADQVAKWNNLPSNSTLMPGQTLKIKF